MHRHGCLKLFLLFALIPAAGVGQSAFLGFSTDPSSAYEDEGFVHIRVHRTPSRGTASATFFTDDPPLAGPKWVKTVGIVTFNEGEDTKTISIPLIDNDIFDNPVATTLLVHLTSPSPGYMIPTRIPVFVFPFGPLADKSTWVILDDEPLTLLSTFTPEPTQFTILESIGAIDIVVNRTGNLSSTVSIQYTTTNLPATPPSGTLTFAPGEASKIFTLAISDDTIYEGKRNASIYLKPAVPNGALFGYRASFFLLDVMVLDDEPLPTVMIDDLSIAEGNTGIRQATFTVRLSNITTQGEVGFDWSTRNGTAVAGIDYVASSGTDWIVSGQTVAAGVISVPIISNSLPELNKTFFIDVKPRYGVANFPTVVTGTILNDDGLVLSPQTQRVNRNSGTFVTLNIGVSTPFPQRVAFSSSDPDTVSTPGSVTMTDITKTIALNPHRPGRATITATLVSTGSTATCEVVVIEDKHIILSPTNLTLRPGASRTVTATAAPSLLLPITLSLTADAARVEVPPSVVIPPGGSTAFSVKGVRVGATFVNVSVPEGSSIALLVDVVDTPTAPGIDTIVPSFGSAAGGTDVIMSGKNLQDGCVFRFGGSPASHATFGTWLGSWTSAAATTPPHPPGPVDVTVACDDEAYTLANSFTYMPTTPEISGVMPSGGSTLGGTLVRITGTEFQNSCWAFFDGIAATTTSVLSATEIIATVPPHHAASVAVALRCSDSPDAAIPNAFTYGSSPDPPPSIAFLTPEAAFPGEAITINGARFRVDDAVLFAESAATILDSTPDSHTVVVPDRPRGDVHISVSAASGDVATAGETFRTLNSGPPQILTVVPAIASAGAEIELHGAGFRPDYKFQIRDAALPVVSLSYNRAVVKLPDLPVETFPILVINSAGDVSSTGPSITIVADAVVISTLMPDCATTEGGGTVTIRGKKFQPNATASFGGFIGANARTIDGETITVTIPPNRAGAAVIRVTNPDGTSATLTGEFVYASPFDPHACEQRMRPAHH